MRPDPLEAWLNVLRCILLFMAVALVCAGYTYYIDSKRSNDDPQKRHYSALAVLFAPVTWPLLFAFSICIFLMRVLIYGVFLVLCVIALIIFRKPFILQWLHKIATSVGDKLLQANTLLIRLFLNPGENKT